MIILAIVLNTVLAAKILGISVSVYAILQATKKSFPSLGGWYAVALDIALAAIGAVVVVPPDQLFSMSTFTTLAVTVIAAASAAGVHGTVKSLS